LIRVLRNAIAVLGVLAAIVGLYLALDFVKLSWMFWCLVAASLLIAVILKIWPSIRLAFKQWRDYPSIASKNLDLESRVLELETATEEATNRAQLTKIEGIAEGRAQIIGAILAAKSLPPRIVAIADYHGRVSLVAATSGPKILVGARFRLVVASTTALRGIVQVVERDPVLDVYFLICVEPTVPGFWQALLDRVDIDTAPPADIRLERDVLETALSDLLNSESLDTSDPGITR